MRKQITHVGDSLRSLGCTHALDNGELDELALLPESSRSLKSSKSSSSSISIFSSSSNDILPGVGDDVLSRPSLSPPCCWSLKIENYKMHCMSY